MTTILIIAGSVSAGFLIGWLRGFTVCQRWMLDGYLDDSSARKVEE